MGGDSYLSADAPAPAAEQGTACRHALGCHTERDGLCAGLRSWKGRRMQWSSPLSRTDHDNAVGTLRLDRPASSQFGRDAGVRWSQCRRTTTPTSYSSTPEISTASAHDSSTSAPSAAPPVLDPNRHLRRNGTRTRRSGAAYGAPGATGLDPADVYQLVELHPHNGWPLTWEQELPPTKSE